MFWVSIEWVSNEMLQWRLSMRKWCVRSGNREYTANAFPPFSILFFYQKCPDAFRSILFRFACSQRLQFLIEYLEGGMQKALD